MSIELLDTVKSYMEKYPIMINDYFSGRRTEKELTDVTTQPFWYSMTLSKRRMDKKGITSEVNVKLDDKKTVGSMIAGTSSTHNTVYNVDMMTFGAKQGYQEKEDEVHESGMLVRKVVSNRTYKKDGRIIYRKKDHEYCQLSVLKSLVKDGKVICPNCGYEAEVSTFSDGCDSCGAHYTVNDFEPKVSGFSVEENVQDKIIHTLSRSYLTVVSVIAVCWVLGFILNQLVFRLGKSIDFLSIHLNPGQMSIMFMIIIIIGVLSFFICSAIWIPLGIMRAKYVKRYGTMYDNVDIVKNFYNEFSPADFSQKLECKLKNILLADSANEVAPFATLNLSRQIEEYKDVIDCNLVSFRFENATKMHNQYVISGDAKVRLFEYKKNKIVSRHIVLHVTMQGKEGVVDQPINQLKEHKCPNCASSVNLLKGSICEYCDTEFSYDDFDWMVTRLEKGDKPKNVLAKVRIMVPVLFLICYIPVFYIVAVVAESSGMQANVVYENDKIVYVNEEFFADKEMYDDIKDLMENHLLKDVIYNGKELDWVSSASSDDFMDMDYLVENPEEFIEILRTKWLDMGYREVGSSDGFIRFEKDEVYFNYERKNVTVMVTEQPLEYNNCMEVRVEIVDPS